MRHPPGAVGRSVGVAVGRARRGVAFLGYSRVLRRAFRLDEEGLRGFQRERLVDLAAVYERVAFQRRRLREAGIAPGAIRELDDLRSIAPIRKADLVAVDPAELAAVPPTSHRVVWKATSGSTAEPFRFMLDQRSMDRGRAARNFVYRRLGADRGPIVELFDNPLDGPNARGRRGQGTPGMDRRNVGYRLPVDEQTDLIERVRPRVLYGNRSHLVLIAEELRRRGHDLSELELVVSSSETLTAADRELLTTVFDAPVRDVYGMAEVEAIAWEDGPSEGYRVLAPRVIVEVLNDGEPAAPGEAGEIVITSLDNPVMPFLRYASGDLARVPESFATRPPAAGATTLWLERIEGRRADCLRHADGGLVSPWQATTSVFWGRPAIAAAVRQWQITQQPDASVEVAVVPASNAGIPDAIREDIMSFVRDAVGSVRATVIEVSSVEHDPSGKFRPVRSHAGR